MTILLVILTAALLSAYIIVKMHEADSIANALRRLANWSFELEQRTRELENKIKELEKKNEEQEGHFSELKPRA